MREPQEDGVPLRDHLESLWRQTGKKPRLLEDAPELPDTISYLWQYFLDLHSERPNNGFSPGRLTATVIKDWCEVFMVHLEYWEIKAIREVDSLWISMQNKAGKK